MKLGLQIDGSEWKNHSPVLYIPELSPLWLLAISWKVLKGLKINLVHTQMLMRGSTDDKNHNPILHFTLIISPYFFIKRLFSLHVLVYRWCWITSSAFYRQQPFGEHSLLPAIFLLILFCVCISIYRCVDKDVIYGATTSC